ncbi:hypothetical protein GTW64_27830 [Streptomyces sp. SID4923]|nr:hypothetical protein [Streptomyces sp. SID4923]
MHRLDRAWDGHDGTLIRYADDLVVMCFSRSQAEQALARLVELLGELGLKPKVAKTRIVHLEVGGGRLRLPRVSPTSGPLPGGCTGANASTFSHAGPRTGRCSTPENGSGRSLPGAGSHCIRK